MKKTYALSNLQQRDQDHKQSKHSLAEETKENPSSRRYTKIMFNDVVYCIGEFLLLRET